MYKKYLSEKEFEEFIKIFDDSRDRLIFRLAYGGFFNDGLTIMSNLKLSDVNLLNMTVLDKKIDSLLLKEINDSRMEHHVATKTSEKTISDKLIWSEYLLRERERFATRVDVSVGDDFNGQSMSRRSIINRVTRLKALHPTEMKGVTLSTVHMSGLINRILSSVGLLEKRKVLAYLQNVEGVTKATSYNYWGIIERECKRRGIL